MRIAPFLVLLLLLPLPASAPAAPAAQPAPEWHAGDSWQYKVTDESGKPVSDLSVKVVDERDVRAGGSTVRAYNLTQKLTPWTPANASKLPVEARWGPIYTIVTTNLTVGKKDLCTLSSDSTIRSVHYSDVTEDHELLIYSPSDGRLRFPLAAGTSWNATFNLTRTRRYPFHVITDNSTVSRLYECQAFEKVPDGKEGFRIRWTDGVTGSETVSWYGPRYRSEVRREERDAAAGTDRVYTLVRSASGQAPSIFSSPQVLLAIAFGVAAAVMLAGASYAAYRARYPAGRRKVEKKAPDAPPGQGPAPSGAPPATVPPGGKGRSRSL
jgi:hypothetical protein